MASLNKILLLGNLTREPELKYAGNGTAICRFGLAVNTSRGGQDGERKDEVCFVDIVAFGRQAETASEYLSKGRPALVEGRLQFQTWESQDGQKRSKHEVIAERIQFMPRGEQGQSQAPAGKPAQTPTREPGDDADFVPPLEDEDIPFVTMARDEWFHLHDRERFLA